MTLGKSVFMGDEQSNLNTVIMKCIYLVLSMIIDLKSLFSIKSEGGSFIYTQIVELISIHMEIDLI